TKIVLDAEAHFDLEAEDRFDEMIRTLRSNPSHVSKQLRGTVRGCSWAYGTLQVMIETIESRGFLYPSERDSILHIFGLNTEDLFTNSFAWDVVRPFIEAGWSTGGDYLRVQ